VLVEAEGRARHYDYADAPRAVVDRVERLRQTCAARNVPLAAAALQFPLHHPAVACVIPGMRNRSEVEANVAWLQGDVPNGVYREMQDAGLLRRDAPIGEGA